MKIDSPSSSAQDIEAIVRRVFAEMLSKQHSGGESARSDTGGEQFNLEDFEHFELPDDLGSMFTAVTLPNEIKDETRNEGGDGSNDDADTADPDSLCDDTAEKIGDLEQKLALANASNEMFEEEIRRLKSIIEGQTQDIGRLNDAKRAKGKEQAHLEAKISKYRQNYVTVVEEKQILEDKLARQKKELAKLNKKVELSTSTKAGIDPKLVAKVERQKQELARLNKQVENKKAKDLPEQIALLLKELHQSTGRQQRGG